MNIGLRPTEEADLDFVVMAENAEENRPFVNQWPLERHRETLSSDDAMHFVIESAKDSRPLGYVILAGLAGENKSIELGRIVVTEKGRGVGREALRMVKKMAFEELGAHRLWLDVIDYNARALALYKSEGFIVEGTLRECFKAGDRWDSLIIMSMLRDEYESQREGV